MDSDAGNIYSDSTFRDVDIGEVMRVGHPDIVGGDNHIVQKIKQLRETLGRPLSIIDVGSGSGHLCVLLAQELPDCRIIANEIADMPAQQARIKLADYDNAEVYVKPFETWSDPLDVIISWGTHHHLGHDYLHRASNLLKPGGLLIVGDELCPEYLTEDDQARLDKAEIVEIEDGYIFDNKEDLRSYRETKIVPEWNLRLEKMRQRALWTWYKFVGDFAVARDSWMVVIAELQIARDDLITGFAEEHKTSAHLLQRELELNGFTVLDRTAIGDREPELQSFIIFTCKTNVA